MSKQPDEPSPPPETGIEELSFLGQWGVSLTAVALGGFCLWPAAAGLSGWPPPPDLAVALTGALLTFVGLVAASVALGYQREEVRNQRIDIRESREEVKRQTEAQLEQAAAARAQASAVAEQSDLLRWRLAYDHEARLIGRIEHLEERMLRGLPPRSGFTRTEVEFKELVRELDRRNREAEGIARRALEPSHPSTPSSDPTAE